jgi:hypothetical protein
MSAATVAWLSEVAEGEDGIPFTTLLVPSAGVALPDLNGTAGGNFGGIVVADTVFKLISI